MMHSPPLLKKNIPSGDKQTINALKLALLVSCLGLGTLSSSADAAVVISFSQVGNDVHGILSGGILLSATPSNNDIGSTGSLSANTNRLFSWADNNPSWDRYNGGSNQLTGLSANPTTFTGSESFGYATSVLYVGAGATPSGIYTPTGTFIWENNTMTSIGLGNLTSQIAYTAATGDTIVFSAVSVPEPSSTVLLGVGCAAFSLRRRRHEKRNARGA